MASWSHITVKALTPPEAKCAAPLWIHFHFPLITTQLSRFCLCFLHPPSSHSSHYWWSLKWSLWVTLKTKREFAWFRSTCLRVTQVWLPAMKCYSKQIPISMHSFSVANLLRLKNCIVNFIFVFPPVNNCMLLKINKKVFKADWRLPFLYLN